MSRPRLSFEEAKRRYVYRYTMEHVPSWAHTLNTGNGFYYAPQYRTDREWYDNTLFPGDPEHKEWGGDRNHCVSRNQSWPLGKWLTTPYTINKKDAA